MISNNFSVRIMPGDFGGCGFYRSFEPARVVSELGIDIEVNENLNTRAAVHPNGTTIFDSVELDVDVLIIQRPLIQSFVDLIPYVQKKGIACIVEIDDDLKATPKDNIAQRALDPEFSPHSNWKHLVTACEQADLVTCSTPNLARRYAPHGRSVVLRNLIPEEQFKREKQPHEDLRVGWTGTVQTHASDIIAPGKHVDAALQQWADDPNFYVVGDGARVKEGLWITADVVPTGWVPRENYFETVNGHLDIGIVPLALDEFNRSKSYLKQLEMASQGIPSVVSPTDENVYLANITGNKVVRKGQDWQKGLKLLLQNRDYYLERSDRVRESVRELTYENHAEDWADAWKQAIINRRNAS